MDVALLSVASKKSFNYFGMLAAKDYWFDSKVKRFLVNTVMNLIPIDRKVDGIRKFPIEGTIKLCNAFMNHNQRNIIIFPEGTRARPHKGLKSFSNSCGLLSVKNNMPIVPICHNSGLFWKNRRFIKQNGQIIMRIGPAILGEDAKKITNTAYKWIYKNFKEIN